MGCPKDEFGVDKRSERCVCSLVLGVLLRALVNVELGICLASAILDEDSGSEAVSDVKKPVIFDCRVANLANCFPMIPSGKAHNEMLLPDEATDEAVANAIDAKGRALV